MIKPYVTNPMKIKLLSTKQNYVMIEIYYKLV